MEKVKISNYQFTIITTAFTYGLTVTASPQIFSVVKQDAWLSLVVAALMGLFVVWVNTVLSSLFPGKTIIEINEFLLGKWLGSLVSLGFILIALFAAIRCIWFMSDYFTLIMPETPPAAINLLFIVVVSIGLLYGLESTARCAEIFWYTINLLFAVIVIFNAPNLKLENIFPVGEGGIIPVLKGAVPILAGSVLPVVFLNMLGPVHVENPSKINKAVFSGYLLGMFFLMVTILECLLVFGSRYSSAIRSLFYLITNQINIGNFFSRLDIVMVYIWLTSLFVICFVFAYFVVAGLARLLKIYDYQKMVLPLALIIFVFSDIIYPNVPYQIWWDNAIWPPYVFTYGLVLPLALLIIGVWKRLKSKKPN